MQRSRFALLIAGFGAAGLAAALPAQQGQQGQQAEPTRVIVYKTPT